MKLAAFLCAISLASTVSGATDIATYEPLRRAFEGEEVDARELLEQSLESYEHAGDHHGAALSRLLLAMWALDSEKLERAQTMLQAEDDVLGASMAVWLLANLDREAGHYDEAVQRNERALAWICEMETAPFSIEQVLPVAVMLGMSDGIENESPAIIKAGVLWIAECFTRISHGQALTDAGRLREAEIELFQAFMISRRMNGKADHEIASALGDLRFRQDRLEEARANYVNALGEWTGTAFGASKLEIVRKLVAVDASRGAIPDAIEWSVAAEEQVRAANKPAALIGILIERGNLFANTGQFDEAELVFQQALAAADQQPGREETAGVLAARADANMSRGQWLEATTDLDRASEIYRDLGRSADQGITTAMHGLALARLGMRKKAEDCLIESKELLAKGSSPIARAFLGFLTALFNLETGRGTGDDVIAAIASIEALPESKKTVFGNPRLLRTFRAMVGKDAHLEGLRDKKPIPGVPAVLQALALLNQGQFAAARTLFLNALEGNLAADMRAQIAAGIATTHWWEGNIDESIRYLAQAADALEVAIEDLPNLELLTAYLGSNPRHIFDSLLEFQIEHGRPEDALGLAERARARAFLKQIGGGSGQSGSLIPVTPSGLTAIRSELPPDTTMIVYFISRHRMHTWVLDRESIHHVARAMDSRTLDRIACWGWSLQFNRSSQLRTPVPLNQMDPTDQPQCRNQDDIATDLETFEELIAPIETHLLHPRLIIVPHGQLHRVPFAAIRDDRGYLVERYTITYAPSASSIRFLHAMETPVEGGALVVGDPPGSGLIYATEEAMEVAKAFRVTPHLGKEACEPLLYGLDPGVDLVHLSTHGFYELDDPMASYVALAPCKGHDGKLEAKEIAGSVDLRGVNLVVLSACSTATGTPTGGDEILGLTRALLSAGTPGVISTLWKVDDLASRKLMIAFYGYLLDGCSAADALRNAQLDMLRNGGVHAAPGYWAAFSLYGDPQGTWDHVP